MYGRRSSRTPPEMDREKIIYGYTYKPTYKGPHIWHDHTNHLIRLASDTGIDEAMLLTFAAIIAPLILCMVAGLGLAATMIYEHVTAETSQSSKLGMKWGRISKD